MRRLHLICILIFASVSCSSAIENAAAQVAVHGKIIHTMSGRPIQDGMVVIKDGKIAAIGSASEINVPDGYRVLEAEVVTPGLIDAHSIVGFTGILNYDHDQDQLERSAPIQPALRAVDGYNAHEDLIEWVRGFGVTTLHTGHAPGELISGQTFIVKTTGNTAEDATLVPVKTLAATLSSAARKSGGKSPGTRGKMMSMLRAELIKAREYRDKQNEPINDDEQPAPARQRDLGLEALVDVLDGKLVLMITADRAQDISNALRLAREFEIDIWLDSATEAYLLIDDIKAAGVPVLIHPTMKRAVQESENLSFETAGKLVEAGIPVALQSGYESYVPKTRVVLFEAALAAANGLTFQEALATITIDAARILGIDDRVGSLEVGKDGDIALYDGDPFEYTTHCTGVVIEGQVVSETKR